MRVLREFSKARRRGKYTARPIDKELDSATSATRSEELGNVEAVPKVLDHDLLVVTTAIRVIIKAGSVLKASVRARGQERREEGGRTSRFWTPKTQRQTPSSYAP